MIAMEEHNSSSVCEISRRIGVHNKQIDCIYIQYTVADILYNNGSTSHHVPFHCCVVASRVSRVSRVCVVVSFICGAHA